MSKKLTRADLKRIEDLNKKVNAQKVENAKEKVRLKKVRKELEAAQKKLDSERRELKNQRKQQQNDKEFKVKVAETEAARNARGNANGPKVKQLQEELLQLKTKFNAEGKRARQFQQERDQLRAENNVLARKLKNLQARRSKGEDPRIKHLNRENKMLKKQMRLLMIELNKKRRWFQRCIKSFKSSRQRWIKQQEDTLKKKGVLVKYVFLDDVKQMKLYKDKKGGAKKGRGRGKFKNRIKVKSRDGGVIVLRDVDIVVLDDDDDPDDDKSKKPRKSRGDILDDTEALMEQIQRELEEEQAALGGDDYKDNDSDDDFDLDGDEMGDLDGDMTMSQLAAAAADAMSDDETASTSPGGSIGSGNRLRSGSKMKDDYGLALSPEISARDTNALEAQLVYFKKELDDRTDDVEKLKDIMSDAETYPNPQQEVKQLLEAISQRGEELANKMVDEVNAEEDDVEEMKTKNDRWSNWLGGLSMAMAKNGALFKQLLDVYEFYLKELKGRVGDLETVNHSFYTNKGDKAKSDDDGGATAETTEEEKGDKEQEQEEDEEDGYEEQLDEWTTLKKTVNKRHDEVEGQFKSIADSASDETSDGDSYGRDKEKEALDANAEKVRQIREGLLANNGDWRQMIDTVSTDYDGMKTVKKEMVSALTSSAAEMKVLLDLVIKIPKRKILEPIAGAISEEQPAQEQPEEKQAEEEKPEQEQPEQEQPEQEEPASEQEQ